MNKLPPIVDENALTLGRDAFVKDVTAIFRAERQRIFNRLISCEYADSLYLEIRIEELRKLMELEDEPKKES